MPTPTFQLDLVGDGPSRPDLERLCRQLRVERHVTFHGARSDARGLLAEAKLFVQSSLSEGISLTLLEAMAAGVPIVATRVGGTPEVVNHGVTGLLVPPRDPAALAAAMLTLLADSRLAERMSRLGADAGGARLQPPQDDRLLRGALRGSRPGPARHSGRIRSCLPIQSSPSRSRPRALFIAYTFPPVGGAGVQRTDEVREIPAAVWLGRVGADRQQPLGAAARREPLPRRSAATCIVRARTLEPSYAAKAALVTPADPADSGIVQHASSAALRSACCSPTRRFSGTAPHSCAACGPSRRLATT